MRIQLHEPWKKGMSITYQDIKAAFFATREHHQQMELILKNEIGVFIEEFKKSLSMDSDYFLTGVRRPNAFGGQAYETSPRVTIQFAEDEYNQVSEVSIATQPMPGRSFLLGIVIGGDKPNEPKLHLQVGVCLGKCDDGFSVRVEEERFLVPESVGFPKYQDVCSFIKAHLLDMSKG